MKINNFLTIVALVTPFATLPVGAIETVNPQVNNAEVILLAQSDWQEYGSEEFTVKMPGEPISSQNTEEISEGMTLTFDDMTFQDDDGAYAVIYTELPSKYLDETDSKDVLNEMSMLFLMSTQLEGLKEFEESINFQENPGLEYRIDEEEIGLILRLYLVQERVYFLFAVSEQPNQINQFIDSFNLL